MPTKRRRVRSAPIERPAISVTTTLRSRIERIAGPAAPAVFAGFENGEVPGTGAEFHAFERRVLEVARQEFIGPIIAAVLDAVHEHDEFVVWAMGAARCSDNLGSQGDKTLPVRVAGGYSATVTTPYMSPLTRGGPGRPRRRGSRGKGGGGLLPVLGALGFACRVSPYVASLAARTTAQLDSHAEAVETLADQGIDVDVDTVRRIVARVADAGIVARERGEEGDLDTLAGKRVVACFDGGRLRYRIPKPGRVRKSGRHGYTTPWREPKAATIYTVDENGKKTPDRPVYEGTLAPWEDAVSLFGKTLRSHGVKDADVLAIAADGSENIWREVDKLVVAIGIDPSKVHKYVDIYHAIEHLNDAAKLASGWTDHQREQWVRKQVKRLKRDRVEQVVQAIEQLPTANDDDAESLSNEAEYFRKRIELMRYDRLRKAGLPIGTGAVESAIRRIVNHRLKGPGIFWTPENAERLFYLRSRVKAGRWSEVEAAFYEGARRPGRNVVPEAFSRLTE